jgi:AcrR family transcriptional regulator
MSSTERRARAKENLRRAILDAARELFATEDYRAVSMRRIAEKIDYSPTALYLHFKDRDEILFQLIEEGFAMLSGRLLSLDTPDPIERLAQGAQIYLDFAFTQPHYYRLMFQLQDKELIDRYMPHCQNGPATFEFIRTAVTQAIEMGLFRNETPEIVVSHTIWAHVHGAVSLVLSGHLSKLPEELHLAFFTHVLQTTLRGLQASS